MPVGVYADRDSFGLADDEVTFVDDDDAPLLDPGRDAHAMTVLGPVEPDGLGVVLPHEHLLARPPATVDHDPDVDTSDHDAALADAEAFSFAGGGTIVDCTTADNGRDLAGLRWVATRVATRVIATAGFHLERHSGRLLVGRSVDAIADDLVREATQGDQASGARPGQLKAGSSLGEITPIERLAFAAVARAHLATGLPIITHTEAGSMGEAQVALLASHGVDPERVTVCHLDRLAADRDMLLRVLATGATIGFDQLGKPAHGPVEPKARVIADLVEAGYADRIVISHDIARRSLRPGYGGAPGLAYILDRFVLMLMEAGVPAAAVRRIIHDNPARQLTIQPVPA